MESDNLTTFTCLILILKGQLFFLPLGTEMASLGGCRRSSECLGCKAVSDHKLISQQGPLEESYYKGFEGFVTKCPIISK